ncbi:MAG TPA: two-component regulator propeller domain-containing protein, partial [Nitrosopumilaceae archaeon]|nr:two-component regulator propeller domain-containing protein [Nitrosopumilaceae archaeon]
IGKIVFDKRGNTWVAAEHGLLKISTTETKVFTEKDGLPSIRIQTICEDYEGNLWVGSLGGGVCMFKDESIVTYNTEDGLSNNKIYSVTTTSKGMLLAGSFNGIDIYNGKSFKKLDNVKELKNIPVSCFFEDSRARLWVGTETEGVFVFEQGPSELKLLEKYKKTESSPIVQVFRIVEDKKGNIWVASFANGLYKINDSGLEYIGLKNNVALSKNLTTLYVDSKGILWIGSYNDGVFKFDGTSFSKLDKGNPLSLNIVFSISGDEKGNIFFGTQDGGVVIWDGTNFHSLNSKSGICSDLVNAIMYQNGMLWVGTDKGVNKVTFKEKFEVKSISYYGVDKGFKATEINQNCIFADKNGAVWFGTVDGLTRYNPLYDYPNSTPPKLILSDVKLFYEHVNWKNYAD